MAAKQKQSTNTPPVSSTQMLQRRIIVAILAVVAFIAIAAGWIVATTPNSIKAARQAHYHLRLQILVDGKAQDFSQGKFQTEYSKDMCTANLTSSPFHFHDGKDQFLHIHWASVTGGLLLKNYGWNFISGPVGFLGLQTSPGTRLVPIHGLDLPPVAKGDNYYVYTGDDHSYRERNWNDFLGQDMSAFMASSPVQASGPLDWLIPTASAHEEDDALTKLNDFRGNIVIFAQKDKPTDQQIKDRFSQLQPLPTSACSG